MNNNYVVGLDFGTLSGRAVVVRASAVSYTHLTLPTNREV